MANHVASHRQTTPPVQVHRGASLSSRGCSTCGNLRTAVAMTSNMRFPHEQSRSRPAGHLVDTSLNARGVHGRTHAIIDLYCAISPSVVVASFWPANSPELLQVSTCSSHAQCIGQVRWNAVTQMWSAGVGQHGRSFYTEEEAAIHWSAELGSLVMDCACMCTCPTSVYKRVHWIGAHAPEHHDSTESRSFRMSAQKPQGEQCAARISATMLRSANMRALPCSSCRVIS
jgi:hypothetical protein